MSDDTKQAQEVKVTRHMAKRTAKNSVFLDLFQDKKNLLKLYKTLHPEDTDATEDTLDIVTIDNVFSQQRHRIASFLRLALIQISGTLYTRIKKTLYL